MGGLRGYEFAYSGIRPSPGIVQFGRLRFIDRQSWVKAEMNDAHAQAEQAKKGSPFLNTAQAAFYVGLARETLEKMRQQHRGPRFRRHGRYVRYHIADLDAWSEASSGDALPPHEPG